MIVTYCQDSEKGIVAICAGHANATKTAAGLLPGSSCFGDTKCRIFFEALCQLDDKGETPNPIALRKVLKEAGCLGEVGGMKGVNDLFDGVIPEDNLQGFCEEVVKRHKQRRLCNLYPNDQEKIFLSDPDEYAETRAKEIAEIIKDSATRKQWLKFYSPLQCAEWEPPSDWVLVGNNHIQRKAVSVIAGPGGVGKSRATAALAVCGALGMDWLDLTVHTKFKTLIVQDENGRHRLKSEMSAILNELPEHERQIVNEAILISDQPEFGMAFDRPEFREFLSSVIDEFQPDLVILDPWNSTAKGDGIKDYRLALDNVKEAIPRGDKAPALVIVAHTRKDKGEGPQTGRELLKEVSGSYVLGSAARCVMAVLPASKDMDDDRIVFETCKNNDGDAGPRSAWHRRNGPFEPCPDFDWEEYLEPADKKSGRPKKAGDEDIANLLGNRPMNYSQWKAMAMEEYSISKSTFDRTLKRVQPSLVYYDQKENLYRLVNIVSMSRCHDVS